MVAIPFACPAARHARTASRAVMSVLVPGSAMKVIVEGADLAGGCPPTDNPVNAAASATNRANFSDGFM
jgi:hypothetical protein